MVCYSMVSQKMLTKFQVFMCQYKHKVKVKEQRKMNVGRVYKWVVGKHSDCIFTCMLYLYKRMFIPGFGFCQLLEGKHYSY